METLLFYINAINGGGAERVILQLAHHFSNEGYRSVLVTSFVDEGKEYVVPDGVIRLSMEQDEIKQSKLRRNISRIKKLREICKKERPVAVISFMAEPNFRSIIATIGLKTKRIVSVRNDPQKEYAGKLGWIVGKLVLPHADGCVFQTEDAKAWFPIKLQKKSSVITNDVKEEFFAIHRSLTQDVVSVGRLSKQKNHALLISAFACVAERFPKQKLLLYGAGQLENDLREQIASLGMEDRILLMGATDDVAGVLKQARVFVLSSDYEGMPNCLMEALAAGVPCISTDCPCGGPRMLITHGENGLLVPVRDQNAMASAIEKLLSETEFADMLGNAAKARAEEYYPDKVFAKWKKYVEEVIQG